MRQKRRIIAAAAVLCTAALPAAANNPPRPDGVLYLILLFPVLAVATHLAGVLPEKRGWPRRLGHGALFTLLVLFSAAGTELGAIAMLVIVVYGLLRAARVIRKGQGVKRFAIATVMILCSLAAGFGYIWALGASSASAIALAHQRRTMAEMRTISTAIAAWSADRFIATPDRSSMPREDFVSFAQEQSPPAISATELEALLVPEYLGKVPLEDGWRRPFDIRFDHASHRLLIRSAGADGHFDGETYTTGAYPRGEDERDIVCVDGQFIAWPDAAAQP